MYIRFGKCFVDFFVSGLVFVVLTPVLLIVSIIILFKLGPPILFRQQRPGLEGKPFILLKFRTMIDTRDSQGRFLPDKKRITRFGRFLRSISIDELPELFNVLKGDMSIVGTRPLLMQYLDRYTLEQARRHEVKPGITPVKWLRDCTGHAGWAQVNAMS